MQRLFLIVAILLSAGVLRSSGQTCLTSNLAAGKTVKASTLQTDAPNVVDGNVNTEWQPTVSGNQWLYVDLGQNYTACKVILKWTAYHSHDNFIVQFSADTTNWTNLDTVSNVVPADGPSGSIYQTHTVDLSSNNMSGRYLRLFFINMVAWDSKLEEVEVYNKVPVNLPVVSLTGPSDGADYTEGDSITITATASETGGTISKVEFYQGSTKIGEDATSPYSFTWTHVPEGEYVITAKAIDASLGSSASTPINVYVDFPDPAWSMTGNRGTTDSSFVGTTDSTKLVFRTKNLKRMTVLPNGNMGIGADTPTAKLHIRGNVRMEALINDSTRTRVLVSDSAGNIAYKVNTSTPTPSPNSFIQSGNSFGDTAVLGTKDNNSLDLYTNNQPRARITNTGNLLLGTVTDNGGLLQINGGASVSGPSSIAGVAFSRDSVSQIIKGDSGRSILIGSRGANNSAHSGPGGFSANGTGNIFLHMPFSDGAGLEGNIKNSLFVGGNSSPAFAIDTIRNAMVVARDFGSEPIYGGAMIRNDIVTFGGSQGFLRDDGSGGSVHMLGEFTGNIYLGYNVTNWITWPDIPSGYIQLGTSQHNLLALFGGFHASPPGQSTLAGPSVRPEGADGGFYPASYFRVAAGKGTGTGTGSDLRLAVALPGTSGTALNPYTDVVVISASTGNVGIGKTDTAAKLAVAGTVTSKRSVAIMSGWPDYVFRKDYPLIGLSALDRYIREHHHLPGVSPAMEVDRSGLDLGDGLAVLLKKVEELTLYTLQQDKRLAARRARLESQERQIEELKEMIKQKAQTH